MEPARNPLQQKPFHAIDLRALLAKPVVSREAVDLRNIEVVDDLDLSGLQISAFDFSGSTFHGTVTMAEARFGALTWFRNCRFRAGADFSRAVFCHDARFDGAVLERGATFSHAEFRGVLDMDAAVFRGAAYLDHLEVLGSMSMAKTLFAGPVSFESSQCMGGLWCASTRFSGRLDARAMEVHGRTWLRGAAFEREHGPGAAHMMKRQMTTYGHTWL